MDWNFICFELIEFCDSFLDETGRQKMQDRKVQDQNLKDDIARHGVQNEAPNEKDFIT